MQGSRMARTWSYSALGNCSGSLVVSMSKAQMRGSARCSRSGRGSRLTLPPCMQQKVSGSGVCLRVRVCYEGT